MEHNSNLFGDASFLAVPAIHFFGFPGYYTSAPPRLPACVFENPARKQRQHEQLEPLAPQPWLCGCLAKTDPHHMDVGFYRQEPSVEDITIRFSESPPGECLGRLGDVETDAEKQVGNKQLTDTLALPDFKELSNESTMSFPESKKSAHIPESNDEITANEEDGTENLNAAEEETTKLHRSSPRKSRQPSLYRKNSTRTTSTLATSSTLSPENPAALK